MIRRLVLNNLQSNHNLNFVKRSCHHHSRTFPKDTDFERIGEIFIIKTEIDKLKIKADEANYEINMLRTSNTIHSWGFILVGFLQFLK